MVAWREYSPHQLLCTLRIIDAVVDQDLTILVKRVLQACCTGLWWTNME